MRRIIVGIGLFLLSALILQFLMQAAASRPRPQQTASAKPSMPLPAAADASSREMELNRAENVNSPASPGQDRENLIPDLSGQAVRETGSEQPAGSDKQKQVRLKARTFVAQDPAAVAAAHAGSNEFYLVFSRTPGTSERFILQQAGIDILDHVSRQTWRAQVDHPRHLISVPGLIAAEPVWPEDKLSRPLWAEIQQSPAANLPVVVSFNKSVSHGDAIKILEASGAVSCVPLFSNNRISAIVPRERILQLASSCLVRYADVPPPPDIENNVNAAALSYVNDLQSAPYDLTGTNVHICVRDGGQIGLHPDFGAPTRVTNVEAGTVSSHSTHVAGTIAGSGAGSAAAKGMAVEARIFSYIYGTVAPPEMEDALDRFGARLSNHSYGHVIGWEGTNWLSNTNLFGAYSSYAEAWDEAIHRRDLIVTKSAGNDRNDDGTGNPHDGTFYGYDYFDCIEDRAAAKNIFCVGAVEDDKDMTTFSNWGPTDDGRIKPDIVANGYSLYSTTNASGYGYMSGTSMSAPAMCGILALMLEQCEIRAPGIAPPVELLKAIVINTAEDLGNKGPDYSFGWGLANAKAAVDTIRNSSGTNLMITIGIVSENSTSRYALTVGDTGTPLRLTLVWTDPAGNPAASDAIKNDLDLILVEPGGSAVHYPYVMPFAQSGASPTNPAVTGTNEWDNVEQIEVETPAEGTWELRVVGTSQPEGDQTYALAVSNGRLAAPVLEYAPTGIAISVMAGHTNTAAMTISNSGAASLSFSISDDAAITNYTWLDSDDAGGPVYAWIDVSTNGTPTSLADDAESSAISMNFDFPFYGGTYSSFRIGDNGGISLSPGDIAAVNASLPSSSAPGQFIGAFWDDLNHASAGSNVYLCTDDRLVVSYLDVPRYGTATYETFQIILHAGGRIVFQYESLTGVTNSCTVGIQDTSAGPSEEVAYNSSGYLKNGLAIEFTPEGARWLSYTPAAGSVAAGGSTTVTFTASAAGLAEGTYTTLVTIVNNDPDVLSATVPVVLTVTSYPTNDIDGDGIPNWWEILYYGGATNADPSADTDLDGQNTWAEWVSGMVPTNPASFLAVSGNQSSGSEERTLVWPSTSNRVYGIHWTTNLSIPPAPWITGIAATPPENVYTDTVHATENPVYYRLRVEVDE